MMTHIKKPLDPEQKRRLLKRGKKLLAILGIVLAALYCCYQFYQWRFPSNLKTEVALEQSVYDAVDAQIFVVRDEHLLSNTASGKVIPLVEDGMRVAKGDVVAMVFPDDADAANYLRAQELEEQISYYEQLAKQYSSVADVNALNEEAFSILLDGLDAASSRAFPALEESMDELGETLIRRQLAMGEQVDFSAKISALRAELANLQVSSDAYTTITAQRSGYYISSTDGLENTIPYESAATVTLDTLQKALEAKAAPDSGSVGKTVDHFDWYLLCVIETDALVPFESGNSVTVRMPFSGADSFTAKVEGVEPGEDGVSLAVLKCSLMNESLANLRQETAQLVTSITAYYAPPPDEEGAERESPTAHTVDKGVRVSSSAVRVQDGEKGVYVLRGNVVRWRRLNVVYSDQTYVISATTDRNGETIVDNPDSYLKQYDEVIVEGKDLYDGKIVG